MKRIRTVLVTLFIVAVVWSVYKGQTDVMSRGQAMEILSNTGHVQTNGDILIYSQDREIEGYNTLVLQSLEMMSNNYAVYVTSK
jgi:hypothetical protein